MDEHDTQGIEMFGFLRKDHLPVPGEFCFNRGVSGEHPGQVFVQVTQRHLDGTVSFTSILISPEEAENAGASLIKFARLAREH